MYVSILKLLIELASLTAKYVHDKQLIDAGSAQQILKGLDDVNDKITIARRAIANVDSVPISEDKYNTDK